MNLSISWWTESQNEILPIAFTIVIIVSIIVGILLKNKSQKIKNLPFVIITIILLIAEVIKQIRAIDIGYNLWSIPLHYCSMFLLWFSLASFGRGKVQDAGRKISLITGLPFIVSFIICPNTII